jgi:glycosyltransferase involved in cell wall biosynthesis
MDGPRIAILAPYVPIDEEGRGFSSHIGGVERYVIMLSIALRDQGWDVTIVYPSEGIGPPSIEGVALRSFPRRGIVMRSPLYNPIDHLRALQGFDLVHTQATYPILSDLNSIFTKMKEIPSVVTYHFNPVVESATGRLMGMVYGNSLARLIGRHDRIIFSSSTYRKNTNVIDESADDRVRIVPMGVDVGRFTPDHSVKKEKQFLFVGRLIPYKDLHLLLRSMKEVKARLPDHKLVIAGTGPLESDLKQYARDLDANVAFAGRVSDDELLRLYRSSVATILSSHNPQEAFGMVLLESMSCGTRVIAADIPGVREVASIGGAVVEPNSETSLADAMAEAAQATYSSSDMVALHKKIEERFSWSRIATMTSDVYRELL